MSALLQAEAEAKYPWRLTNGVDDKAWAKRFVYRFEKGDRTMLPIQVQFAYLALEKTPPDSNSSPQSNKQK